MHIRSTAFFAYAIASVCVQSVLWLMAILVNMLVGLAQAFVAHNLAQPYPELVAFSSALTMVGAFAYTAAGLDLGEFIDEYETGDTFAVMRP